MMIKPKYILYTAMTTIALSCASFQTSEACCCKDDEEKKNASRPLLGGTSTFKETVISHQPKAAGAEPRTEITSVSLSQSIPAGNSVPDYNRSPSQDGTSFLGQSFEADQTLNSSISTQVSLQQATKEFKDSGEDIISYLGANHPVQEIFNIESNQKGWSLSATIEGTGVELVLIYIPENHPQISALKKCFDSKVAHGKSVRKTLIAPTLRLYIEQNDSDFYKKLAGVFLFAHEQAQGKIYSALGSSKEYCETIFDLKSNDKMPIDYRYLYVLTAHSNSSTLAGKKRIFFNKPY